jgi:hypothetical protein
LPVACGTKPSLGPNLELTSLGCFVKVLKDQPIENCGSDFAGLNGVFHCGIAKGLIHRFGNISIPKPVSFENLMAHHDDLEKVDLPVNSAYAQTAKFQEKFRQTGGGNRS